MDDAHVDVRAERIRRRDAEPDAEARLARATADRRAQRRDRTTVPGSDGVGGDAADGRTKHPQNPGFLVQIAWCVDDPSRVGEAFYVGTGDVDHAVMFGRGSDGSRGRATLVRRRPHGDDPRDPLDDVYLSRDQLRFEAAGRRWLEVANVGRGPVRVDGQIMGPDPVHVADGCLIEVGDRLLLRVAAAEPLCAYEGPFFAFGGPDPSGMVGESAAAWDLRRRILGCAALRGHVLVTGESGTGKELVPRALHAQSDRAGGPYVACSAATLPEGLIVAELFGSRRNYPGAGMPELPGLVGQAQGGLLFIDEIGELPEALQTPLLRVLQDTGEYRRLGEARSRTADVRFVAATNRDPSRLREDLVARLTLELRTTPLRERRGDIPLILRHLLRTAAARDGGLAARLLDPAGEPRVACTFVSQLMRHPLPTNVRQLDKAIGEALVHTPAGSRLTLPPRQGPDGPLPDGPAPRPHRHPRDITTEEVLACLDRHGWAKDPVWRELGLRSRFQLRDLIKRHGLIRPSTAS